MLLNNKMNTIINPNTGERYSIFDNNGRELLKLFIKNYKMGGTNPTKKRKLTIKRASDTIKRASDIKKWTEKLEKAREDASKGKTFLHKDPRTNRALMNELKYKIEVFKLLEQKKEYCS